MLPRSTRAALISIGAALGATLVGVPDAHAQSVMVSSSTRASSGPSLSAIGLGLLAGGLLTSAPGIAILAACKEGKPCHNDATTAIGWMLAGPGIPPIVFGIFFIWLDKPHGRNNLYNAPKTRPLPLQVTAGPLPSGGGMVGATYTF